VRGSRARLYSNGKRIFRDAAPQSSTALDGRLTDAPFRSRLYGEATRLEVGGLFSRQRFLGEAQGFPHAAGYLALRKNARFFEPKLRADFWRLASEQPKSCPETRQISARLPNAVLHLGDDARDLGSFVREGGNYACGHAAYGRKPGRLALISLVAGAT
jgi:hypothetical protein